jgi:2-succinyl-5-enolpyruvyl-6-hydroxy-3-cyclohexene-1-carboxylate synthase
VKGENPNIVWAGVFLDELARGGVRVVCVAPGSRSTPLVLAAAADTRFRLVSLVDERSAGFFALGVGKASRRPAAVITTSGTAAANLYPAVIEAAQGEVPLILLTADRPHRLRDTDGNQAIDQIRLFGSFPRAFFDVAPPRVRDADLRHLRGQACRAVALAQGPPSGPVHLNFPFEKPLEPVLEGERDAAEVGNPGEEPPGRLALLGREEGEPFVRVAGTRGTALEAEVDRLLALLSESARGVIVAGPVPDPADTGRTVLALAAAAGFPVLADPLSGARFGPHHGAQVVAGYDLFLRSSRARSALDPDLILRVGASPTSASLLEYLSEHRTARQVVVDQGFRWKDHTASAREYVRASPGPLLEALALKAPRVGEPAWRSLWERAEETTREVLEAEPRDEPPLGTRGGAEPRLRSGLMEGWILEALAALLPPDTHLLIGSSMPIRDLDAFGRPRPETLHVHGNRGSSGIDGLVSTALGMGAVVAGPAVAVLGDLAFLHDMNGLLALKTEGIPVGFVVVNNDGGGIFHTLPVRRLEPSFTRFFATPHGLDLGKVADLYGIPFARADSLAGFRASLPALLSNREPFILEIRTDRETTHGRLREVISAVEGAMERADWLGGSQGPGKPRPQNPEPEQGMKE